jgi:endoglucanase
MSSCNSSDDITSPGETDKLTIVAKFGDLSVSGSSIVDKDGNIFTIRGMSLFWSQIKGKYYNFDCVKWLRDDWNCTVIRAAMGIESGGYLENPEAEYQKVKTVIDACIELGIYVIVDWHDHHGEEHLDAAKEFFGSISETYGHYPNIIYEIYNEPLNLSWVNVLKPHSESIITAIRSNDPDNLIIVGTPNWSQDVDAVIGHEIQGSNIAYSLHFYTGTHGQSLRNKASAAINAGLPLFVSEWGISEADAGGEINIDETNLWAEFLETNNLSWCNWSVTNKDETSSILLPVTTSLSNWTENDLSEAGQIMRDYLIRMNGELFNSLDSN